MKCAHRHGDYKGSIGRGIKRKGKKSWRNEQEESLENRGKGRGAGGEEARTKEEKTEMREHWNIGKERAERNERGEKDDGAGITERDE